MTHDPINLLLDVAWLGEGFRDPKKQTGIFRVVETLAARLLDLPELNVTLCASEHTEDVAAYLSAPESVVHEILADPVRARLLRRLFRRTEAMYAQAAPPLRIPARVLRRLAYSAYDVLGGGPDAPFDARALEGADVFHSTFYPLPPQVQKARLLKFLTIYDLIPLRRPEYFRMEGAAGFVTFFRRILASLPPDGWATSISQATKDDFCAETGHDPARVFVTPLAADPSVFYPVADAGVRAAVRRKYHLPEDVPYLLSLSTLEPRKNIDHVIRAFARLAPEQPDLHLVLTGSKGWDYAAIFDAAEAAPAVRARIHLPGRVDEHDLAALYSDAMAFVYLSRYEGFGLPPLEAMACGVPVVTSDTSSLPEVVGDAGTMLDPDDGDGLCQTLLTLADHEDLRTKMAQASLARAALFSWERCAQDTLAAYRAALSAS